MLTATVRTSDGNERREYDRTTVDRTSTARDSDAVASDVVVRDFSRDGIGFTTSASFKLGSEITIGLSGGGSVRGRIIRRHRDFYGCAFAQPLDHRQMESAFGVSAVFPLWPRASEDRDMEVSITPRWSGVTRLSILVAGAVFGWTAIAAAVVFTLA